MVLVTMPMLLLYVHACLALCMLCWHRALQEAQEIFGIDFDFEEFEQFDDDEEEDDIDDDVSL